MKTVNNRKHHNRSAGFSIAETIGVMSIVAILGTIICPKVMQAMQDAQVVAEVASIKGIKNAMESYYQQHGKLAGVGGAAITTWTNQAFNNWDRQVLAREGFISELFKSRLGTSSYVRLVQAHPNVNSTDINHGPIMEDTRGTLPYIRGNNGIYDLTKEYSRIERPHSFEVGCSPRTARSGLLSALQFWSFDTGKALVSPLLGVGVLGELAQTARFVPHPTFLAADARSPLMHLLSQMSFGNKGLQACYPMETGRDDPTPGYGGGGSGSGASYADNTNNRKTHNDASASDCGVVAEMVIDGVSVDDAYRLSVMLDGTSQSNWAYWDSLGRVKYDFYDVGTMKMKTNRRGVIFIYLGHGD